MLKKKLPEIDILTDGYVVVPPSIHPNGPAYVWHKDRSLLDCEPADCPEWLLTAMAKDEDEIELSDIDQALPKKYPASSGEVIIQRCSFMRHCAEDAAILSEPDWYHSLGVLAFTVEAPDIVHKYSGEHPDYKFRDTEAKMQHWKRDGKAPPTCQTIQDKSGDEYCRACPYNGDITSPIVLGYASRPATSRMQPMPFPTYDVLPGVFHDFAVAAAKAIQCPVDYVACALLVVVSILMGGKRSIQLTPEWFQQGNLWIAMVGPPSAKKTPALLKTLPTLQAIEQEQYAEYQDEKTLYEMELRQYEADLSDWKKERHGNPPIKPENPILKRLKTSDTTVEALGKLLADNPQGIGMVCDELSSWMRSMNQYKGGNGADRSHYLAMWSNSPITIDRKNKVDPILVPMPYVAIVGGIQPDVLLELRNQGVEDGMKERFLFCCPLPNNEPPKMGSAIPAAIRSGLDASLRKIFDSRPDDAITVTLSQGAADVFLAARQEWHWLMQSDEFSRDLEAYYVKMQNYLGRFALVLHEMKRAIGETDSDIVSEDTMREAKALADYFLHHAAIALGMVMQTREEQHVEKAIRWIQKKNLYIVNPRDMVTNKVAGCKKASEARTLLKTLSDYGYGYWSAETDRLIIFQDPVSISAD